MRVLFEIDYKNYKENGSVGKRPSVRAIIIKDNLLGMIYSKKYDYFKFPGGGIERDESNIDALIREVKEESGLNVIKDSILEYGLAVRKEAGKIEDIFIQENYYYTCKVSDEVSNQNLDAYEADEGFMLKWVKPMDVITVNLNHSHNGADSVRDRHMYEREARVIECLIKDGII